MTRILVDGHTLGQLIASKPKVEIELTKLASDAVAEQLLRKIDKGKLSRSLIDEVNAEIAGKYRVPRPVADVLEKYVKNRIEQHLKDIAAAYIEKAIDEALKGKVPWMDRRIEERVDKMILDKVAAAMKVSIKTA